MLHSNEHSICFVLQVLVARCPLEETYIQESGCVGQGPGNGHFSFFLFLSLNIPPKRVLSTPANLSIKVQQGKKVCVCVFSSIYFCNNGQYKKKRKRNFISSVVKRA